MELIGPPGPETAVRRSPLGNRRLVGGQGASGVLVQVAEPAGLDPAAFQAGIELFTQDSDGEPRCGELAVTNHPVNGVDMEVEVPGRRLRIHPLAAVRHSS